MTRNLYTIMLAALAMMTACNKDEPVDNIAAVINPDDPRLEILATPVWRYCGGASDHGIQKITYTMRDASSYFIIPMTEERDKELAGMVEENNELIHRYGSEGYLVNADRSFITSSDYVSDRYFDNYHRDFGGEITIDYTIILPTIFVMVADGANPEVLKEKLIKKYGKKIKKDTVRIEQWGQSSFFEIIFDCKVHTSAQVLDISNEIYMRDDVKFAEPDMIIPFHLCD
ncbi:MAG: hypothetical protein IKW83_02095 [Muribaculaceae bacterium]|nr:hypothetical protein [Muribaculaceae bacterium]